MLPIFHDGGYGSEIHEQSEMAINCWGQWELNNQPVWILEHMQVAFDDSVTGKCAGQAQKWLRQVRRSQNRCRSAAVCAL